MSKTFDKNIVVFDLVFVEQSLLILSFLSAARIGLSICLFATAIDTPDDIASASAGLVFLW